MDFALYTGTYETNPAHFSSPNWLAGLNDFGAVTQRKCAIFVSTLNHASELVWYVTSNLTYFHGRSDLYFQLFCYFDVHEYFHTHIWKRKM